MWRPFGVACSMLVGFAAGSSAAQVIRLEAVDISPLDAPVRLWGRIEFSEAVVGGELHTTFRGGEVTGHNHSEKAIVTLIVRMERFSERATDISQPEWDWFFSDTAFASGAHQTLQSFGATATSMPYDGASKPLNSQFTVEVVYAQFEDGSEFGARRHGLELLTARKRVVEHLRELNEAAERHGEDTFVRELHKGTGQPRVETVLRALRERHGRSGFGAARDMLRGLLQLAEQRRAAFDLEPQTESGWACRSALSSSGGASARATLVCCLRGLCMNSDAATRCVGPACCAPCYVTNHIYRTLDCNRVAINITSS